MQDDNRPNDSWMLMCFGVLAFSWLTMTNLGFVLVTLSTTLCSRTCQLCQLRGRCSHFSMAYRPNTSGPQVFMQVQAAPRVSTCCYHLYPPPWPTPGDGLPSHKGAEVSMVQTSARNISLEGNGRIIGFNVQASGCGSNMGTQETQEMDIQCR